VEVDTDADTEADTLIEMATTCTEETEVEPLQNFSPTPFRLTDFSNLIGITASDDQDDAVITIVDPDAFAHASPDDDLYGWEAELERKLNSAMPSPCPPGVYSLSQPFPYHVENAGKRRLLHRVFSISGTTPNS
jgi:hypothetical protein